MFLGERWPRLADLPRVALADLPTPVTVAAAISREARANVLAKRDDRTGERYGGNKVRKLEFLLGDAVARRADVVLTTGAAGSHHVLATAIYGRHVGLDVHAVLVPQPWTPHVESTLRAVLATGATVHPVGRYAYVGPKLFTLATAMRFRGRRPYVVPPGGSNAVGAIGYVEAALELAHQIDESRAEPLEPG